MIVPYRRMVPFLCLLLCSFAVKAQSYPQGYFRNPLNIPMQLVANFGELRLNHWHMGLDIRTNQRVNLPVYAAADGYIARISVEPGGFGQAIYINHPNGFTTLYGHLNAFFPALAQYVKEQQYKQQSWQVRLEFPADRFPVKQGDFIALSGSTGASQGPHVHFEIRDTKTDNCLNPLLFRFPIPDAVPPTLFRIGMYDRNKSVYDQTPQLFALRKGGNQYTLAKSNLIKTGNTKISFAIGAVDRFTHSTNPNGIYSAKISVDGTPQAEFILNNINYEETRYLNAQIDYRYKYNGGSYLQHLSRMPGDASTVYNSVPGTGIIHLTDSLPHTVLIEVQDAAFNTSQLQFQVQYDERLAPPAPVMITDKLLPNTVNVFERDAFELYTTEYSVYDTVSVGYAVKNEMSTGSISPLFAFCSPAIPVHDFITIRLKPSLPLSEAEKNCVVIKSTAGNKTAVDKAFWNGDWLWTKFRQFGTYQAFRDTIPPTVNAPGYGDTIDLRHSGRIVFTPKDNFDAIQSFKAELDGQWLMCSNDKGAAYIYTFDEHFPSGVHQLKLVVQDIAGNSTTRVWYCRR